MTNFWVDQNNIKQKKAFYHHKKRTKKGKIIRFLPDWNWSYSGSLCPVLSSLSRFYIPSGGEKSGFQSSYFLAPTSQQKAQSSQFEHFALRSRRALLKWDWLADSIESCHLLSELSGLRVQRNLFWFHFQLFRIALSFQKKATRANQIEAPIS